MHKFISLVFGLLFFGAPRFLVFSERMLWVSVGAIAGYLCLLVWYNYWYLRRIEKYNIWVLLRPALLVVGGLLLLLVIPNAALKIAVVAAFGIFIALTEMFLGNFAENVVLNETLLIAFSFLLAMFAFREYFPSRLAWAVIGTFFLLFFVTRSFYEFIPQQSRVKLLSAGSIALFCSQLLWAMSLLPFHYSALAVILFNVFYLSIVLNYHAFFQVLNPKKIYFHVAFFVFCSTLVLLLTPWKTVA